MLDADAEGADWREVAAIVLELDVAKDPKRARRSWASHLARGKWIMPWRILSGVAVEGAKSVRQQGFGVSKVCREGRRLNPVEPFARTSLKRTSPMPRRRIGRKPPRRSAMFSASMRQR